MENETVIYGPYVGEFGWEVHAWAPHVCTDISLHAEEGHTERRIIVCPVGSEALYSRAVEHGAELFTINRPEGVSAEWMSLSPNSPTDAIVAIKSEIEARFGAVRYHEPQPGSKYAQDITDNRVDSPRHDYSVSGPHGPDESKYLGPGKKSQKIVIGVVARGRKDLGQERNFAGWDELVLSLRNRMPGCEVRSLGTEAGNRHFGEIDLRTYPDAGLFITNARRCHLLVGESSGTMHLAVAAGVPSVVFGPDRGRERYRRDNVCGVPMMFIPSTEPNPVIVARQVHRLIQTLRGSNEYINQLEPRGNVD
jgi:hypothetical protein